MGEVEDLLTIPPYRLKSSPMPFLTQNYSGATLLGRWEVELRQVLEEVER
ncbi:MAG: hypothetical protein HRU34_20375 [Richelia sp.]|nr:hypothetical protein [Richelia sp.]CDN11041.1 hypothetical protein RintRC_7473 [Richelia intracellularis]